MSTPQSLSDHVAALEAALDSARRTLKWIGWEARAVTLAGIRAHAKVEYEGCRVTLGAFVWISPGRLSGNACLGMSRLPVSLLAGRVAAGDTLAATAKDYGLTVDEVRLACWYVGRHGTRTERRRFGAWARRWQATGRPLTPPRDPARR